MDNLIVFAIAFFASFVFNTRIFYRVLQMHKYKLSALDYALLTLLSGSVGLFCVIYYNIIMDLWSLYGPSFR